MFQVKHEITTKPPITSCDGRLDNLLLRCERGKLFALFHLGLQFCKSIKVAESCTSSDIVDGRSFLLLALLACYLLGFLFSAKLAIIYE